MADRPIPFSAPMVRALLEGRKTQTRRILKPQPELYAEGRWHVFGPDGGVAGVYTDDVPEEAIEFVSIKPGDRLWAREAWRASKDYDACPPREMSHWPVHYEADGASDTRDDLGMNGRYRHARFMPRWASRLTLIVTDVRVQRLQDISEEDAIAEGVFERSAIGDDPMHDTWTWRREGWRYPTPRMAYAALWTEINGPGAWEKNPWVAAYTFTVHRCNIDQMEPSHD